MDLKTALTGAMPFAHLLGSRANTAPNAAASRADDDEDTGMKGKADDEDEGDTGDNGGDDGAGAKKSKAKPGKAKSGKNRSEREEDDDGDEDTDEDEDEDGDGRRMAVSQERARCRAIFAHPAAAGRADLAAHLAFDTELTAEQAIGTLQLSGKPSGSLAGSLASRMRDTAIPSVGPDAPAAASTASPHAFVLATLAKVRGGK